ncbi:MAG TPA: DUF2334 domain-containing protein [Streptosporangiaceae bacterium]
MAQTAGQSMVRAVARQFGVGRLTVPAWSCHPGKNSIPSQRVLVLYDSAGPYAAYGAESGVLAANFASHFAQPVRQPVKSYSAGEMSHYSAVVYLGTNYGEALPAAFLADVRSGLRPVLWLGGNAYQLTDAAYAASHGWRQGNDRLANFIKVRYRHVSLTISNNDLAGIDVLDHAKATVLGAAVTASGQTTPWAVRSGNLTYVSEVQLASGGSEDRSFAIADLMASLFGDTRHSHLAMLRLEDIGPDTDPAQLHQIADLLAAADVPYSVAVYPMYIGPVNQRPRQRIPLQDRPQIVQALRYMLSKGATLVLHGFTHQFGDAPNPNDGQSGEDYEFLRAYYNAEHVLIYGDPVPSNVDGWARHRIELALAAIHDVGLPRPAIWQFPEYGASPAEYGLAASMFVARYERGSYAAGPPGHQDLQTLTEQSPPYLVRDVYGGPVLPETLGYVLGPHVRSTGPGSVSAILAAAAVQKAVVRDNVASVYYHPFLGVTSLRRLVRGMHEEGYKFVSPCAVLKG